MKKTKILLVGSLLLGTIIFSQGLSETKKVSAAEGDTYELVTNASTLSVGDTLVIASKTKGVTLGALSGKIFTAVSSTFSTDKSKITDLKTGLEFTLGGEKDKWDFTYNNKKVGATAVKSIAFDKGTTTWKISIDNKNNATIQNTTSSYGRFLHNVNDTRFTTYTSNVNTAMLLPQLYRKVVDLSVKHDVNFITNCDTKLESKKIAEGAEITLPTEELIKDGYILEGWYTDSEFKNKFVEGTKMGTQDVTLYANWILDTSAKYTVKFMLNDGTESVYTSVIVKENETIEAPTTPTREGYKFTAWYANIDLTEEFNFSTKIASNLTLYAGWEVYAPSTFTKVTSSLTDWTGKYLIVYEDGADAYIFNGNDGYINGKIENDKIQSTSEIEKNICTISKFNNGYSINIKNKYLSGTNNKNSLNLLQKEQLNNISFENNSIKIESNTSILRFNDTQDIMQFKYYRSSTYTSQEAIQLYKLEEKQVENPTIDEKVLTSYTSTLSIDNSKAIRFIGSVKETEFNNISKIGFNFTLTLENDNPISKEYSSDVNKLYKTINDSNVGIFDNGDAIYENNGFLNFSLILKNIPTNITAKIDFYSYAVINGKTYHSLTKYVVIMNGKIA